MRNMFNMFELSYLFGCWCHQKPHGWEKHQSVKPASAFFSTYKKMQQKHISTISSAESSEVNPSLSSTESSNVNTDGNQSTK